MHYVLSLMHLTQGGFLSQSSYGNKHAALFHLFCVHNCTGMPLAFSSELTNLCKAFYQRLTQNRGPVEHGVVGGIAGQAMHHGDGKAPMSVELYKVFVVGCWILELQMACLHFVF